MDKLGSCPGKLRHCPSCTKTSKSVGVLIENPSGTLFAGRGCKSLKCPLCKTKWHVCTECYPMKVHLVDDKLLRLHYCQFHIIDYEGETVNTRRLEVTRMRLSNEEKNNLGLA
jgi:hypothetical protein